MSNGNGTGTQSLGKIMQLGCLHLYHMAKRLSPSNGFIEPSTKLMVLLTGTRLDWLLEVSNM